MQENKSNIIIYNDGELELKISLNDETIWITQSQLCDIFEKDQQLNHDEIVPFSMSSKDMSLVDELPKLIELGIDSFKIEGRMKSPSYVGYVTRLYRKLT